jgi:hypothetical protein
LPKANYREGPLPTTARRISLPNLELSTNLKLGYPVFPSLLIVLVFALAAFCAGQSAPQTETPGPTQSAQPTAPKTPEQEKPAEQPSTPSGSQGQNPPAAEDPKNAEDKKKKDDRMFYVMPNYLTVDNAAHVPPIPWKEKFAITAKGTFDPYEFAIVGVVAGIRQAENSYPAFGQGAEGYAKRYGAAFADQVDGNLMVGGVFPTILKTDPRYFRMGKGRISHRFLYAASRVFVTRRDSGRSMFNIPEFAGNATAIAISNFYYPEEDRGFDSSLSGWTVQMGIDAFGNELKEFWPDVHHYLQNRHARKLQKKEEANH